MKLFSGLLLQARKPRVRRTAVYFGVLLVTSHLLGGCAEDSAPPPSGDTFADAPQSRFVIGATATANEPAVTLGSAETGQIRDAVSQGKVQLTAFVGSATDHAVLNRDMSVYYDVDTKELDKDPGRLQQGFDDNLKPVTAKLRTAAGNQSNLDLLGLLGVLAHTPSPATLFVHSSGLQTASLLDLRGPGSDLDVAATVAALPQDQLPDLTGKRVVFVGLGQVAGPQQRLTELMRADVRDLWLSVCRKAHGTCDPTVLPTDGGAPGSKVVVPTIPVPALVPVTKSGDLKTGQVTTIALPNGVLFRRESADFLPDAERQLRAMVGYFQPDATTVPIAATAIGHTAHYGKAPGARTLSKQRARRVVDVLVAAGVRGSLFDGADRVDGVGFDRPVVPDLDAAGHLIAEAAEQNRTVILTVTRTWSTG
ncbi:OmpA family protein [Amycolatopsis sp. NPDC088138]|uniref:OmpA family protein n=1 Tax=Amycolatopsis sp. NPDC088138 TaxID=3363938 RepID=UPI0038270512